MKRKPTDKDFVPGTEQFIAAVWYAVQHASNEYHTNRFRIEQGRLGKWYYVKKIQGLLGMAPTQRSYMAMRQDILNFAHDFGVVGLHPDTPVDPRNAEAARVFAATTEESTS